MEKNGYIYRESARQDARLKRIVPTEKAENIRLAILKSIEENEEAMVRGIPKEDVELCKQVLWQMYENRRSVCNCLADQEKERQSQEVDDVHGKEEHCEHKK